MVRWIKLVVLALVVASLAWTGFEALGQQQIEGYQLAVNATGYMYMPLRTNGESDSWRLDSAAVDTSVPYKIVPGCFAAVTMKTDAAADTIALIYVDGSLDGTSWMLIDSVKNMPTGGKIRYVHGTANGTTAAATPVLTRYLRFRVTNDDGTALGDSAFATGVVITGPAMNN